MVAPSQALGTALRARAIGYHAGERFIGIATTAATDPRISPITPMIIPCRNGFDGARNAVRKLPATWNNIRYTNAVTSIQVM
jgi:hypothetical protein